MVQKVEDGEFFGKMFKDLGIIFPIWNGQIQEYQGDKMATFILNIADDNYSKVITYLDEHGVNWYELHDELARECVEGGNK